LPGLEPFTAALSGVFFGRAMEARDVGNRLRAMAGTGGMLAIVGPSGWGKSSLLNAALAPCSMGPGMAHGAFADTGNRSAA
jgi:ABC-type nitrate/sulfonate/bicarbonate transport system ATPase subunit